MKHIVTKTPGVVTAIIASLLVACLPLTSFAQVSSETLKQIGAPDRVETRIGALKFFDGLPDKATVEKLYDNLDFVRGVEVFLDLIPGASVYAFRQGCLEGGNIENRTIAVSPAVSKFEGTRAHSKHGDRVCGSPPQSEGWPGRRRESRRP